MISVRGETVRFAVSGDFGSNDGAAGAKGRVARMVRSWLPDFILTVGDSAYSPPNAAFGRDVERYYGDSIVAPKDDPDGTKTRYERFTTDVRAFPRVTNKKTLLRRFRTTVGLCRNSLPCVLIRA